MVEADIPGVVALLTDTFGSWPRAAVPVSPEEHLRWKLAHPRAYEASIVGELDGRIVASCLGRPSTARTPSGELVTVNGMDLAIHPTLQGRGLHPHLTGGRLAFLSGFDATLEEFGKPAQRDRYRKSQYLLLGNAVDILGRPLRRQPGRRIAIRAALRAWRRRPQRLLAQLRGPAADAALPIEESTVFDGRFDGLWERVAGSFAFIRERDARALAWRFADPRGGTYTTLVAPAGAGIDGYVVLAERAGRGYIADVLSAPGREGVVRPLVRRAVALLREAGCRDVRCWLNHGNRYRAAFLAAGITPTGVDASYRYWPTGDAARTAFFADPDQEFHITIADSDLA
jgi:hypothetical protein